jgi:hypothetical protein
MTVRQKRFELRLGKPSFLTSLSLLAATRRIFQNWVQAENQPGYKWRGGDPNRPNFAGAEIF